MFPAFDRRRGTVLLVAAFAIVFGTSTWRHVYHLYDTYLAVAPPLAVDSNPAVRQLFDSEADGVGQRVLTAAELAQYRGEDGQPGMYLAVMGRVFDVSKGAAHYGPGKSYSGFVGRDASVAFHTGNTDGIDADTLTDILALSASELAGIQHWSQFYQRQYTFVGYLHGRFYDAQGRATEYLDRVHDELYRHQLAQDERTRWQTELPPCNVEWKPEVGTRVWCSAHSGGVRRDWRGVPRKFFEPGQTMWRCACVRAEQTHLSYLEQYEGCGPEESSCVFQPEEEVEETTTEAEVQTEAKGE